MRIAYIAPYYDRQILERRSIGSNPSLANSTKLECISKLLVSAGHEVEIISTGEVVESRFHHYPGLNYTSPFHRAIRLNYASNLPVRRIAGIWSSMATLNVLRQRHRQSPFDVVCIWNLREPTIICARHAIRTLRLPTILQYEDDALVDMWGTPIRRSFIYRHYAPTVLPRISACIGCSPHLLAQMPAGIPKLLLRGVVGEDIVDSTVSSTVTKQNRVLFSGTHDKQKGIAQLVEAWSQLDIPSWELHITGEGPETHSLRKRCEGMPTVRFHGLLDRPDLVRIMCSARICVNPHDLSQTPGNLFAFKIVEYLAAGAHVLTTRMGQLEKDLEHGITYLSDNNPKTIAAALVDSINERRWEQQAAVAALEAYGPAAVSKSLNRLLANLNSLEPSH